MFMLLDNYSASSLKEELTYSQFKQEVKGKKVKSIVYKGDQMTVEVERFNITGSTFNLPVFTDVDLNYQAYEAEYSTGSLSGSVDRVADVIVGQEAGEFYFHSDKNALAYTFASSSLISQSLSLGTFTNTSSSGYYRSSSIGFFTQSFYDETIVTCYITGSQI